VYYLPNITRVIISMKTVWEGHMAHIGKNGNSSMVLSGKLERKSSFGDLGVDGRLISYRYMMESHKPDSSYTAQIQVTGSCGHGNETSVFIFQVDNLCLTFHTHCLHKALIT
jgi:hypothetical protein